MTTETSPPSAHAPARPLEVVLGGFFLASWLVLALAWFRLVPLAGSAPVSLYGFFSFAAALGWAAGTLFVQRGRRLSPARRRLLRWVYYLGPQGLTYLVRAMAPVYEQQAAPFAPLWALGVYSVFFLVPLAVIRW